MAGSKPKYTPTVEEIYREAARLRALRKTKIGRAPDQGNRFGKAAEYITVYGANWKLLLEPDNLVDIQGER